MAVASGIISYSISLGRGHSAGYHGAVRALLGGEIIAYSTLLDAGGFSPSEEFAYATMNDSPLTTLDVFHPEIFEEGYLTVSNVDYANYFSPTDISTLSNASEIKAAIPRYQLPAMQTQFEVPNSAAGIELSKDVKLVGRSLEHDYTQYYSLQDSVV